MRRPALNSVGYALMVFVFSMSAAFVCAFTAGYLLQLSLPPSDGAYGIPLSKVYDDQLMLFSTAASALIGGIASLPFMYVAPPQRRFFPGALIVFTAVLAEVVSITPLFGWVGVFGAIPTFLLTWALVWSQANRSSM